MLRPLLFCLALILTAPLRAADAPAPFLEQDEVRTFIDEMVAEHGFERGELQRVLGAAEHQQKIIDAITRPAEAKPWRDYRPIFLTESRIRQGVAFWDENAELLARAEKEYGVPAEMIVAIIGVETRYGRHQGTYRVIDSLATLGFGYPKRGRFFRGQLKEFLIMAREERRDPLEFMGSYAGAMGKPQFIASSFRAYAVDFDGDGHRDLWSNNADVIGSVANYFHRHRWQPGKPIAARASLKGNRAEALLEKGYKPSTTVGALSGLGVSYQAELDGELDAALIRLEAARGDEYWVALHNFYVITRYNHSPLYAMAAYQLSEAIRSSREAAIVSRN